MSKNTRFAANYASLTRTSEIEGTITGNSINQNNNSYMVPELPNLSELVTGTFHDGTPVFSRNRQTRSSRFATKQSTATWTVGHKQLDAVPVPEDEKQIFAMLKLLREKVATLEKQVAENEKRAEDAELEVELLRKEKKDRSKFRRSDSALGTSDDEAIGRAQSKLAAEKARLEVNLRSIQSKLEASKRQVSIIELTVKNVSKERDSALAQLSTAFLTSEELKAENEELRRENKAYRLSLGLEKAVEDRGTHPATNRVNRFSSSNPKQVDLNEAERSRRLPKAPPKSSPQRRQQVAASAQIQSQLSKATASAQINNQLSKAADKHERDLFSITLPTRSNKEKDEQRNNIQKRRKKKVVVEVDATESQEDVPSRQAPHTTLPNGDDTTDVQNKTLLTPLDPNYITNMRENLEVDRQRLADCMARLGIGKRQNEVETTRNDRTASAPPADSHPKQKSALKSNIATQNLVKDSAPTRTQNTDEDAGEDADMSTNLDLTEDLSRPLAELNRRASDPTATAQSNISRRRTRYNNDWTEDNMTSGFFLPDVTIARPIENAEHTQKQVPASKDKTHGAVPMVKGNDQRHSSAAKEQTVHNLSATKGATRYHLSEAAQAVLNTVSPHNKANCTICKRVSGSGEPQSHSSGATKGDTINIPAVVPPSLRAPEPTADNPDPTVRPAQPPRVALAVVVKELNDEVIHLKEELGALQVRYYQTDPSLSRRERKSIMEKIQEVQRQCEVRSDQIYRLSDVAEGQPVGAAVEVTIGLNDVIAVA